jgi:hypothetical protein
MVDRCKRCKRVIKNTMSVIHGYGPSCWKKVPHTSVSTVEENQETKDNVYMSIK